LVNSVQDRVKILGHCSNKDLNGVLSSYKSPCIIMDCEGFERDLLDPAKTQGLTNCDILVETHDYQGIDTFDILMNHFNDSHDATIANALPRTTNDIPIKLPFWTKLLPEYYKSYIAREGRVKADQRWIYFTKKPAHSTNARAWSSSSVANSNIDI
jgi:hypothetical protein